MNTRLAVALLVAAGTLTGCQSQNKGLARLRDLGDHHMSVANYDEAASSYAQYIDRKPGEPDVRANYGRALMGAGRYADAAEQLQLAYSQRPGDEAILDSLADAMMKAGQQDPLFKLLKTNVADRGRAGDHIRLGRYSLAMGDTDNAHLAFTTAAKIDEGRTLAPQLALVDYYLAVGDLPSAERRLRMAYFLAPLSPEVKARMTRLNPVVGPTFATVPEERGQ